MPTNQGNGHGQPNPDAGSDVLNGEERLTPIHDLTEYPGNARRADLEPIAESLDTNAQYSPVIVQASTGRVLVGNHRMRAARDLLGWTHILARWVDVDDERARRIVIADNRTSDLGGYDDEALVDLLEASAATAEGLTGTGYTDEDLTALLEGLEPTTDDDWGDAMDNLADGDPTVATTSFTYPAKDKGTVDAAIALAKENGALKATDGNANGLALVAIARAYLGQS